MRRTTYEANTVRRTLLLFVIVEASVGFGCRGRVPRTTVDRVTEDRWLSSAISPREGIIGRVAAQGVVRLLTTGHRIVTLDVSRQRMGAVTLPDIADGEDLTGFGELPDGSLWTLSGWATLLRLNDRGRVVERRSLSVKQTGLHSGFGRLIFQPLDFTGGAPALVAGLPEGDGGRAWGTLRIRDGSEAGPIRLAQSLATCGVAVGDRMPCWVTNSSAVELIDEAGLAKTVAISALSAWPAHDPLDFASRPHRVIRDVWLQPGLAFWILVRPASADTPDRRGERGLWHIDRDGTVTARYLLPSRARVIVGVDDRRVFLLTAEGDVVSVGV